MHHLRILDHAWKTPVNHECYLISTTRPLETDSTANYDCSRHAGSGFGWGTGGGGGSPEYAEFLSSTPGSLTSETNPVAVSARAVDIIEATIALLKLVNLRFRIQKKMFKKNRSLGTQWPVLVLVGRGLPRSRFLVAMKK